MRVFKTRSLARFTRRERIADEGLSEAIERADRGVVDAELGGGLIRPSSSREWPGPAEAVPVDSGC